MHSKKRIAIIGSGISGLGCAYQLRNQPNIELTIFEKDGRIGGHSNTIDFQLPGANNPASYGIDTGFLVFNKQTYPRLLRLLTELNVPIAKSEMSFSVSLQADQKNNMGLEWAGTNLNSIFAQRRNAIKLDFLGMLKDIARFNALAKKIVKESQFDTYLDQTHQSVQDFLDVNNFGLPFQNWYLLPMIGAIWSCPVSEMMQFPINTLIHFCNNHGLLNAVNRPQWLTIDGGSREYVSRLVAALTLKGAQVIHDEAVSVHRPSGGSVKIQVACRSGKVMEFDDIVFACHSDQALNILDNPSAQERSILSAIPYQNNIAYVHTDANLLPKNKRAWAAWNYSSNSKNSSGSDTASHVCVHYLINKLQPLPAHLKDHPIIVSLNPHKSPKPDLVHSVIQYSHPLFDANAIKSQKQLPSIQGLHNTWFCGAWTGYGFHEDGLRSGELVAADIIEALRVNTPEIAIK